MRTGRGLALVAVVSLALVACGDDGGDTSTAGDGASEATAAREGTDGNGADGNGADGGTSAAEMPEQLDDFPLPDDAVVPFPATDLGPEQDPRETLVVSVETGASVDEVVAILEEGLAVDPYSIDDQQGGVSPYFDFTRDGIPGRVTIADADGTTMLNINLYRSGIR